MVTVSDADIPEGARIASIALGAIIELDAARAKFYCDRILSSLSETSLMALQNMPLFKEKYLGYFANLYRAEGRIKGHVSVIQRSLTARFGALSQVARVKLASSSIEELDAIADRLLTAATLEEALAPKS